MDSLPPEILSNIIDHLYGDGIDVQLGCYASVSLAWQAAIEQRTFLDLPVTLNPQDLEQLRGILTANNARRAHLVRSLNVDLGKSPLDKESRPEGPRRIEPKWWIATISRLFTVIADVLKKVDSAPSLCLSFCAYTHNSQVADWDSILRDAPTSIPSLHHVTKVIWRDPIPHVSEADLFLVTDKLPNLKFLEVDFWDDFSSGRRQRMKRRGELKSSILASALTNLGTFKLRARHEECRDEARKPTNLILNTSSTETDSIMVLRHLATLPHLKVLHLTGPHVIHAQLFHKVPSIPTLVDFQLDFSAQTEDARWFFDPDEELIARIKDLQDETSEDDYDSDSERADIVELYDSDDEDGPLFERDDGFNQFRTMPNKETIPDLLIGAARFAEASTRLRKFVLRHRHNSRDDNISWTPSELLPYDRHFELWYLRSGAQCDNGSHTVPGDESFVVRDRVYWRVGDRWRPDKDIIDAWRKTVGADVKYCFLKDFYDYDGNNQSWRWSSKLDRWQYDGVVEWEVPGQSGVDDLRELRKPFHSSMAVHGPENWGETEET